jgi:poly(3-hydroxybutyrate) depolymerase
MAAIRRGARGAGKLDAGTLRRKTPSGVPYLLRLPAGLDAEKLYPLLITLHGSNLVGGASALASWQESLRGVTDLIVAAPDAGNDGWGNARAGHERVLAVLRDVSSNWPVDLDRVSLDGGSMGAHGAFFLAMYHPDRWAAIAPRCGSARFINMTAKGGVPDFTPSPPLLDNLWTTPVYLIAGAKDENTPIDEVRITMKRLEGLGAPLVYREYPAGGHAWYGAEDRDVLDFIRWHLRDPYPKRVKFVTREPAFGRCSWIEVVDATRPLRIEFTHLDMAGRPLEVRKEYDRSVEVDARIDRDRNRVTVQATGVKTLKVWLSDELLDLDQPVEVVVNDVRAFQGRVERSIAVALEDCRARGDRGAPFAAAVTVAVGR